MMDKVEFEKKCFWMLVDDNDKKKRICFDFTKTAYENSSDFFNKKAAVQKKEKHKI
jgi:hypothetical protein